MNQIKNKVIKYSIFGILAGAIIYYIPQYKLDNQTILMLVVLIVLMYSIFDTNTKKCT